MNKTLVIVLLIFAALLLGISEIISEANDYAASKSTIIPSDGFNAQQSIFSIKK